MPKNTNDITLDETKLFLFVGPADAGKSFAATSFGLHKDPEDRPAYLMELDDRLAALKGRLVVYDSFNNTDGACAVLDRLVEIKEKCIQWKKAPFHTIILDSFTSFNDFSISESLAITEEKRDKGADAGRARGKLLLMTVEDYGYEAEALRKLLWENLAEIKRYANVIVTAHETEYYKPVKVKPGEPTRNELAGYKILARDKISAKLPTKFDEIYHFLPKEVIVSQHKIRRRVVFQDILARSSYPQLNKSTEEYDITDKEFYPWWREKICGTS